MITPLFLFAVLLQSTPTAPTLDSLPSCRNYTTQVDSMSMQELAAHVRESREIALSLAPELRFGPGEDWFPTLPFFHAFDGDSPGLGEAGRADMADPVEIRLSSTGQEQYSWESLQRIYLGDSLSGPSRGRLQTIPRRREALKRSAVLYRVCGLAEKDLHEIYHFLVRDEQAWNRSQRIRPFQEYLTADDGWQDWAVVQFYLYYVRDVGLQGHPQDIELVSVFFPIDPAHREELRITVGSGHEPPAPNNVLVQWAPNIATDGRLLPDTTGVIVELGGHASAPDVSRDGVFSVGLDINWHTQNAWGTRDLMAIGGTGFFSEYRPEMTLPRDSTDAQTSMLSPRPLGDRTNTNQQQDSYALAAVPYFMRLETAIDSAVSHITRSRVDGAVSQVASARSRVDSIIDLIQEELNKAPQSSNFSGFDGFASLSEAEMDTAIAAMAVWRGRMLKCKSDEYSDDCETTQLKPNRKHRVWDHKDFRGFPTSVLRTYLELVPLAVEGGGYGGWVIS